MYLNVRSWEPIIDHINDQYQHYLFEERRIERKPRIPDTRIHCLIYFISPTGHRYAFIIQLEEITVRSDRSRSTIG